MTHVPLSRRSLVFVLTAVAAMLLLLPAVAAAAAPSPPTVTIVGPGYVSQDPPPTTAAAVVDDAYVLLLLDDGGLGADFVRFSNDAGATWGLGMTYQDYIHWYLFTDVDLPLDGVRTVTAQFSTDGGATWGPKASATTLVDEQGPVATASQGYWNNHYPCTASAHDQIGLSGVHDLYYRVDAGELVKVTATEPLGTSVPLTASYALPGETGTAHTIDYIAVDYAGNYSGVQAARAAKSAGSFALAKGMIYYTTAAYVVIDRSAPVVKARGWDKAWHHGLVTVRFSAKDVGGAGLDRIQYSVTRLGAKRPGAWLTGDAVAVTRHGLSKVWYRAADEAQPKGNVSAARSVIVKIL